jgi:hypothetical protein
VKNEFFEFLGSKLLLFSIIFSNFFGPKNSKNSFQHLNFLIINDMCLDFFGSKNSKKTHHAFLATKPSNTFSIPFQKVLEGLVKNGEVNRRI